MAHPEELVYQPGREVCQVERYLDEGSQRMISEYQDRYEFFPSVPGSPDDHMYSSPDHRE